MSETFLKVTSSSPSSMLVPLISTVRTSLDWPYITLPSVIVYCSTEGKFFLI